MAIEITRLRQEELVAALRTAIDEGDASGVANGDVFIRIRKKLNLPPFNP